MATDKKSQHVGNHGGRYTDIDGASRQFTYIDHDPKIKMAIKITKEEVEEAKKQIKEYRISVIKRIQDLSPSLCPWEFQDYLVRDGEKISWNTNMLEDEGVPIKTLTDMCTLIENKLTL